MHEQLDLPAPVENPDEFVTTTSDRDPKDPEKVADAFYSPDDLAPMDNLTNTDRVDIAVAQSPDPDQPIEVHKA